MRASPRSPNPGPTGSRRRWGRYRCRRAGRQRRGGTGTVLARVCREGRAHVRDKELSDPTFEPFWAKVEALGAVVFIHPNSYPQPQRFSKHYFSNVIGNPLDTTMALHWLIFDGVLERYPDLKVIASHGGGDLPAYSGRIDHA